MQFILLIRYVQLLAFKWWEKIYLKLINDPEITLNIHYSFIHLFIIFRLSCWPNQIQLLLLILRTLCKWLIKWLKKKIRLRIINLDNAETNSLLICIYKIVLYLGKVSNVMSGPLPLLCRTMYASFDQK